MKIIPAATLHTEYLVSEEKVELNSIKLNYICKSSDVFSFLIIIDVSRYQFYKSLYIVLIN